MFIIEDQCSADVVAPRGHRPLMRYPFAQYLLTVYALNARLPLESTASPALVGFYVRQTALAQASLVVYGQR